MGLGGVFKSEDNLTQAQNTFALQSGQQKQAMAGEEAAANRQQANSAIYQGDIEAGLQARQTSIDAGQQQESYAAGGVISNQGTPLSVVNSTRAIGAIQVQQIQAAAQAQAQLYMTQSNLDQEGGLQDLESAQGQTVINTDQNQVTKSQQQEQFDMSLLGLGTGILTAGIGLIGK